MKHHIVKGFLIILLFSCTRKTQTNSLPLRQIHNGLVRSNIFIRKQNDHLFELMRQAQRDSSMFQRTQEWEPKAALTEKLSIDMLTYLDDMKISLKKEAGLVMVNDRESFNAEDTLAVYNLFETKGKGKELNQRLLEYENKILEIDPEIDSNFYKEINYNIQLVDFDSDYQQPFIETFFRSSSVYIALNILCNFQNNINLFENEVLTFCYEKIKTKS